MAGRFAFSEVLELLLGYTNALQAIDSGFILSGAIGIPNEAKPENVKAMEVITKEYGVYC